MIYILRRYLVLTGRWPWDRKKKGKTKPKRNQNKTEYVHIYLGKKNVRGTYVRGVLSRSRVNIEHAQIYRFQCHTINSSIYVPGIIYAVIGSDVPFDFFNILDSMWYTKHQSRYNKTIGSSTYPVEHIYTHTINRQQNALNIHDIGRNFQYHLSHKSEKQKLPAGTCWPHYNLCRHIVRPV